MVSSIVGNYLMQRGLLSKEEFEEALAEQQRVRVKLGLIAVAEGIMTKEEADSVNSLQSVMDKRFGDIAVEKGYLAEGEVEALLKKQGNAYLAFAQALENGKIMGVEQLGLYMEDFRKERQLTVADMEDIKSDDADRILPLYIPSACKKYINPAGTAVRTLLRCVDAEIYPEKAYLAEEVEADNGAVQCVHGEYDAAIAISAKGDGLLKTASVFGKEEFKEVNEDALDAIGELLNCINGLHATALSQSGVFMDMEPPEYACHITKMQSSEMLVLPLHIMGRECNFLISIGDKIRIK